MSDKKTSSGATSTGGARQSGAAASAGARAEASTAAGLASSAVDPAASSTSDYSTGVTGATAGESHHNDDGGAKNRLKSQADELMRAAKQRAKDIASEQKDAAASQLGCVARGLRDAAQSMRGESDFAGRYAGKAAEGLERFSEDLRGASFDELIGRTESYARRNPAAFLGGAVAAGFLFARFIKSSRERRPEQGSVRAYRAPSEPTSDFAARGV
jgi:hypothetical protein